MLEINKIYCGDCLDYMKEMPDKSVDLVLTDPPYGINIALNGKVGGGKCAAVTDYGIQFWDKAIPTKQCFEEIFRISKNQIIFGGNYMVENLSNSSCWIVWDKQNTGNFADCELAWTSFNSSIKKYEYLWNGMLQKNMKNKDKRVHPTQKPVGLFIDIIMDYSCDNNLIFDPFLGSGTTAVAAIRTGRRFIGIEIMSKYYEIAKNRINYELQQTRMDFDIPKEQKIIQTAMELND